MNKVLWDELVKRAPWAYKLVKKNIKYPSAGFTRARRARIANRLDAFVGRPGRKGSHERHRSLETGRIRV